MDPVGIATLINAIGRSSEISLQEVLPHYRGVILNQANKFKIQELILIVSGISYELTAKEKTNLKIDSVIELYKAFTKRIELKNELSERNFT